MLKIKGNELLLDNGYLIHCCTDETDSLSFDLYEKDEFKQTFSTLEGAYVYYLCIVE